MVLLGIHGNPRDVNTQLLHRALTREPTLVIDCANAADPHAYSSFAPQEAFHNTYVIEVEMLYKFRDAIARIPRMMRDTGARTIIITTFNRLFAYQNEDENASIIEHAWIMLSQLATQYTVIVGIHPNQKELAEKYCHRMHVAQAIMPQFPD